jgi:integrase/recombinase XerD
MKVWTYPENNTEMARKIEGYLAHLQGRNYSENTLIKRWYELRHFLRWCGERSIERPQDMTRNMFERYQRHVYSARNRHDKPLSPSTREDRVMGVRVFFSWLVKSHQLLFNPGTDVEKPRGCIRLPKQVLSLAEVEQVLNQVNMSFPLALRDRTILEVLYSTGIRRMELCNLKMQDIDLNRGWLMVDQGKGNKDRVVPIGDRALAWLEKYLSELRPELMVNPHEEHVFLSKQGNKMRPQQLTVIGHRCVIKAGLNKTGSCHIFRHTMATLMLEGGADIRYIQEILGHRRLETTQLYTKISIGKLKDIHNRTHPGAHLKAKKRASELDQDSDMPGITKIKEENGER